MTKYASFWQWFSSVEEDIHTHLEEHPDDYAADILMHLKDVHTDLVFDIPFELNNKKHELIISADGDPDLFPIVQELVEEAPQYSNWIIHNLRPRTNQLDQAIELDGLYLEYEDIFFVLEKDTFPCAIDVYIRNYDKDDHRYVHGYFLLLDTLLGEYLAVTLLPETRVHSLDEAPDNVKRLLLLRELVDQQVS
jgi:hypothetical protein